MLVGTPHNFTTCLKNNCAVNLAEHKVAYFENRSMMTKIAIKLPALGRWVMKSIETLSQGFVGTGKEVALFQQSINPLPSRVASPQGVMTLML
ncbi:uncharacterized protein E5676_scaffold45G00530 [Cucumis melo var. makuwa]|uniref:Uncharacterized protein n=1 Tax=Cucumis melo var. makuwa TaxID=1194695 RepID=A0A5A7UG58_CUCMM|nr:uncharacterized protein E6C27_scaffold131G002050 [Cucumis melo var. makuwa]TYK15019.1 uncharacterized protein E5676_scaffold45G00530 [Cucumis melo var. makuwa]